MKLAATVAQVLPDRAFSRLIAVANRRFEPEMVPIVAACDPDGTAVDVGSWYGPWSHWLARRVQRVTAFEPNPAVAAVLRASAAPNVDVHQVAISDQPGELQLRVSGTGRGEEGRSAIKVDDLDGTEIVVEARTLDSYGLDRVRLVKIDVEGYELPAVRGALELIRRWHPILVIELETRFGDVAPVFELLDAEGYRPRALVDATWQDVDVARLTALQEQRLPVTGGYLSAVAKKGGGYVNNITFAHPASTWVPWS